MVSRVYLDPLVLLETRDLVEMMEMMASQERWDHEDPLEWMDLLDHLV